MTNEKVENDAGKGWGEKNVYDMKGRKKSENEQERTIVVTCRSLKGKRGIAQPNQK